VRNVPTLSAAIAYKHVKTAAITAKRGTHSFHILACLIVRVKKPLPNIWFEEAAQVKVNMSHVCDGSGTFINDRGGNYTHCGQNAACISNNILVRRYSVNIS
jgi:hypothetical protein